IAASSRLGPSPISKLTAWRSRGGKSRDLSRSQASMAASVKGFGNVTGRIGQDDSVLTKSPGLASTVVREQFSQYNPISWPRKYLTSGKFGGKRASNSAVQATARAQRDPAPARPSSPDGLLSSSWTAMLQ